jgi:hypothetical protein
MRLVLIIIFDFIQEKMPTDLRKYTRQTSLRLIIGGLALLFLVGGGLIYFIYGPGTAAMGLLCIGGGLFPVALIMMFLWLLEWIVKRANRD